MKTIGRYHLPEEYPDVIAELSQLIKRYKFKEAQNVFDKLTQEHQKGTG